MTDARSAPGFAVVLVHPEIPPNTGNVIRLTANTATTLHLVESIDEKQGGVDTITTGLGDDIVAGGARGDSIDTGGVFKHDDLGRVAAFYRRVSGHAAAQRHHDPACRGE